MTKIYVNGNEIQSTNNSIKSVSSELVEAAARLTSLKSEIDYRIAQRKGIDSRLGQSAKSLRELERKVKAVHQFIDNSMDQYEKADRKAASFTVPGGKSFWEKLGDELNTVGEVITGFGAGLVDTLVSTVEGLWNVVTHPIQTVKGLVHVVQHPIETGKAIWQSITDSWNKDVVNGDAESASHWFGRAFGEAALAVVGTKGVDKAVKLTKGATAVKAGDEVAAAAKLEAGTFADSMSKADAKKYNQFWDYAEHNIGVEDRLKIGGWDYPPGGKLYDEHKSVYDNPSYFEQTNGKTIYPGTNGDPNIDGFLNGKYDIVTVERGSSIDRFGNNGSGRYFSPEGDSFESRALPPFMKDMPYEAYEVAKPFQAKAGPIAPWFDEPGMGKQIFTDYLIRDRTGKEVPATVENLLKNNYIIKKQ
ncbi:TNT domain-containing protein [Neobacillus sp. NPDC097160]|uniref:TNT domain-containing protein n=1 Tax=Neobacillus sp. NPDC097160 TaxID=3364298 RepID=UPI003810667A